MNKNNSLVPNKEQKTGHGKETFASSPDKEVKTGKTMKSYFPSLSIETIDDISTFKWVIQDHKEKLKLQPVKKKKELLSHCKAEENDLKKIG